ncbi:efflux RND transporter periplasmic adaptor subunit [Aneurinibacillus tyrosinisolvens]|uniref:efflux RND transporter periplasmic adaptor subunit n=1 Tax=Aneurinibacillus tyrosinisolvens TaxID=1443435 RepID=UPI00063F245C|nr:efflux RND transporter periplasmic adaptor subunit [Aneurinibacillus tyrosinisolvens]
MKRVLGNVITLLCLLIVIGGAAYYTIQRMNYVTTDNARVTTDLFQIAPPAAGRLSQWSIHTGSHVQKGMLVGSVQAASMPNQQQSQGTAATIKLESPIDGTVIKTSAQAGQSVTQSQPLAMVANLSNKYILAYIDENEISNVQVGDDVDVYLDADSGNKLKGTVSKIGSQAGDITAASSSQSSRNSKQTERVPVEIRVPNFQGDYAVIGMNATVKIHK